ncbi:MAG TPA: ABC transporter permease [Candidatus Acidoferrum sp.]|nr:ABC transporter permease [Candidatus Acidoferrum sp.]
MWSRVRSWLRAVTRRSRMEREMDAELRFHIEAFAEDLVRSGIPREEALRRARIEFGGVERAKEECREARGLSFLESLIQDLRYAMRMLQKSPGFTTVAVLTLALGIGANTAIFSLINALGLRPLPVQKPEELVLINPNDRNGDWGFSYPLYEAVRNENRTLAGVFVSAGGPMNVSVDGQAELAPNGGEYVSGSYFSTLGVEAVAGRTFTAAEDRVPGQSPVAVISYGYWRRRFALSPSVIGKAIYLNGVPFTIIGVTPPRFFGLLAGDSPDITAPMTMYPQLNSGSTQLSNPGSWWLTAMARLRPGVSAEQGTADLSAVFGHYMEAVGRRTEGLSIRLRPGAWGRFPRHKLAPEAILLMTLVGLVLLIACTNVANLLLARGAARQKEIALRLSIGAGRGRLIRQLITESLLLALLGGAAGFLFASWGTRLLPQLKPEAAFVDLSPDTRVFVFAAGITLLAGVLFGLTPAFRATRISLVQGLQGGVRQGQTQSSPNRVRNGLVVSQVVLSTVLLFVAGLFTHSLRELLSAELGFRPEHVLVLSVDPTLIGYQGPRLMDLYKELLQHARAVPGVMSVSLSQNGLVSDATWGNIVSVPGYTPGPDEEMASLFNPVGPDFFRTAGIPILLGRDFGDRDNETAPKVAIVSEAFARKFFGELNGVQKALGQTIGLGVHQNLGQFQIVGIVKDSKQRKIDETPSPVVYFPFLQADLLPSVIGHMTMEVRTASEPAAMTNAIRRELRAVEKNLPIYDVKTLTRQVEESLTDERALIWLVSSFGLLALLLASVGLYGVISYSTVRRTGEIGIRVALGADRRDVMAMVLREALRLTAFGVALGLALAVVTGSVFSSVLYGVSAADPLTIIGAGVLMFAAAALAAFLPARRAMRVDPMVALRYE